MEIATKYHSTVIGRKGAHLHALEEGTGTKIQMPKRDSGDTSVTITGEELAVQRCQQAIRNLVKRGYSKITHPGTQSGSVIVPANKRAAVIGKKWENINAIQAATNTRVNMPERDSGNNQAIIVGKKEDIAVAREALQNLIDLGFSELTHPNYSRASIKFPVEYIKHLIGPKGQTVKSISGSTNCRIDTRDPSGNVIVVGPADGVAQARKEIQALLEKIVEPQPIAAPPAASDADVSAINNEFGVASAAAPEQPWAQDDPWRPVQDEPLNW